MRGGRAIGAVVSAAAWPARLAVGLAAWSVCMPVIVACWLVSPREERR